MYFDLIIGNPPYCKNLHLKILERQMNKSDNILWLSPVSCLLCIPQQTTLVKKIKKYIKKLEVFDKDKTNKIFGISTSAKLGCFYVSKEENIYDNTFANIYKKLKLCKSIRAAINNYASKGVTLQGDNGYGYPNLESIFAGAPRAAIVFNTKEEEDNFRKSFLTTWPYKFIKKLDDDVVFISHMPFLDDYTQPWTDERLYEFFQLTDDEIKEIEKCVST